MKIPFRELAGQLKARKIDAYLVTKDVNVTYLTQFHSSESWLLVTPQRAYYITDFRYLLEARQGLTGGITVKRYTHSLPRTVFELARSLKVKRLGFDERHLSHYLYGQLDRERPRSIKLVPVNDLVEDMREIKREEEISQIRECLKLNIQAYRYLKGIVKPGITEQQILARLEAFVKRNKAGFSFPPIIASGPNSSFPHARVTERRVKSHEPILLDTGIDINGYKSDLTRIFFLGKIPPRVKEVFEIVRVAQQKAIAAMKPGVGVAQADQEARKYLGKFGLAKYFGHSLGHGVGLEIHEAPRLSQRSSAIFREKMVVTAEPAVYLPNAFGIRLEDMVLINNQGCEVLSGNLDYGY